jgi:predicted PurR-regulated permease PerM
MSSMNDMSIPSNSAATQSKLTGFLESVGSVKGMKGIFTIILTATILAVFELVFFYIIVAPTVVDEMNTNIKKVGNKIAANLNKTNKEIQEKNPVADIAVSHATRIIFNDINGAVLNTTASRENNLIESINNYTIYTGVAIVLVLLVILYIIWKKIKSSVGMGVGFPDIEGVDTDMTDAILSAVITVGALIAFQIMFYFYGKQYRYPGTEGNEELLWVLIGSIDPADRKNSGNKLMHLSENESELNTESEM